MKQKFTALLPYGMILGVNFYLLPCLMKNTGIAMLLMLCVMPLIAFVSAMMYGMRNGFDLLLSIAAPVLFLPTIFIYYNASAWVYAVFYAVIVLAGTAIGHTFHGKR